MADRLTDEQIAAMEASPTFPLVFAFALEMERKLEKNRRKGDRDGWSGMKPVELLSRLDQERNELVVSVGAGSGVVCEAADVANFAMMIADVAGGMKPSAAFTSLLAEVRALRECEKVLRMAHEADAIAEWFTDTDNDGIDVRAALAGVRAGEPKA